MEIREATAADREAVRAVATRSLEASYSLSPQTIESAVMQWYGEAEYGGKIDREDLLLLVCERDGEFVGFAEGLFVEEGGVADLLWIHVHPDYRGESVGKELFEATRERLLDRGASHLRARVLAINEEGNTFYEDQGFEKVGEDEVKIDGSSHVENLYLEAEPTGLEPRRAGDGRTVYVDHEDGDPGSLAAFNVVYADDGREDQYGFYCTKCSSLANAMDAMGRIECSECGNVRKPTRWDAAYM